MLRRQFCVLHPAEAIEDQVDRVRILTLRRFGIELFEPKDLEAFSVRLSFPGTRVVVADDRLAGF